MLVGRSKGSGALREAVTDGLQGVRGGGSDIMRGRPQGLGGGRHYYLCCLGDIIVLFPLGELRTMAWFTGKLSPIGWWAWSGNNLDVGGLSLIRCCRALIRWAGTSSRKNLGWCGPDDKLLGYVDVGRGGHLPLMLSLSPSPPRHTEYRCHLCLLDMRSGRWLSRRPLMLL
uniref:Uncharacterized protein n=1 Tax=Oryza meridionalis TaxID=40149 RepID=A0A0E0CJP1_9ORYZ